MLRPVLCAAAVSCVVSCAVVDPERNNVPPPATTQVAEDGSVAPDHAAADREVDGTDATDHADVDSDADSRDARAEADASCANVAGVWDWFVTHVQSSCGSETAWSSIVTITQNGCGPGSLETVGIKQSTHTVPGSVEGDLVTIGPGDFSEAGGITHATYVMTVTSPTQMQGYEEWYFSGDLDCSGGTADVTATRR